MSSLGFIILRHVNNETTNQYWQLCYDCIRNHYPTNHIMIIDDNSNETYITEKNMYNVTIIKSEYPKRGELLPYIYYLKYKLFDIACIIHDSVFIQHPIDFLSGFDKFKFIWHFEHDWDNPSYEIKHIQKYQNTELTNFYHDKEKWKGCFGSMCVISHDYLLYINNITPLSALIDTIQSRDDRMAFERVIACLLSRHCKLHPPSLFGSIQEYSNWGIPFNDRYKYPNLPMLKIWSGR